VAALDSDESGDFALRMSAADFFGSAAKSQVIRVFHNVLVDGIYLIQRFLDGRGTHDSAVNPDGKEDGVHAAFAHARDVNAAIGIALAKVKRLGEKALRGVIVRIEDD